MNVKNYCKLDGSCSRCGNCCTNFLFMTDKELQAIKKYAKENKLSDNYDHLLKDNVVMMCPFNNQKEGKCDIYEVRPEICRTFKCNVQLEVLEQARNYYATRFKPVDMREEVFGHAMTEEDIMFALSELLKQEDMI